MKVLIVEGAAQITERLKLIFDLGWPHAQILFAKDGNRALELVNSGSLDLVILDLNLSDISGLEVLKKIRFVSRVPVIVTDGQNTSPDDLVLSEVQSLTQGADGYFQKSLDSTAIFARIRALLRRTSARSISGKGVIRFDNILIDPDNRPFIIRDGQEVSFTPREWDLLMYLVQNSGRIVSCRRMAEKLSASDASDAAVKECVRRLRMKLGDYSGAPRLLKSHRGKGYSLQIPAQ